MMHEDRLKPLRWYRDLSSPRGRMQAGAFLIEGGRAVEQVMQNNPDQIIELLCVEGHGNTLSGFPVRTLSRSRMNSICTAKTPQGIAAVVSIPSGVYEQSLPEQTGSSVLLLEDVQDPGNVGTLVRAAAAFGFSGVILSRQCADPFSAKCVQAAAGTILTLWLRRSDGYLNIAKKLTAQGYTLAAADLSGTRESDVLVHIDRLILALGNEGSGLSGEVLALADSRVKISIDDAKVQSLNVALSGAILMSRRYEGRRS